MATLADRAKARREELGLSKSEVARRVASYGRNCAIQNIRQLELASVRNITYLAELARALETDALWLQTGRRETPAKDIDPAIMMMAWDAANVIVDEHKLEYSKSQRMHLAVRIYQDLTGAAHSTPEEAAKSALLKMLTERRQP